MHLKRNFAACDVTIAGKDLPAKHVRSLGQTTAGRRQNIRSKLCGSVYLFYGSIRFLQGESGAGSIDAGIVLEMDGNVGTIDEGVLLRRGTQKHSMRQRLTRDGYQGDYE